MIATTETDLPAIDRLAELAALAPPPAATNLDRAAALLADVRQLWDGAEPTERRELATTLFDAVYCDLDTKRVVAIQLKKALLPLRNALPSVLYECGSDGIRYPIHTMYHAEELDRLVA